MTQSGHVYKSILGLGKEEISLISISRYQYEVNIGIISIALNQSPVNYRLFRPCFALGAILRKNQ